MVRVLRRGPSAGIVAAVVAAFALVGCLADVGTAADNGSVAAQVTVTAPATPCIELSATSVSFGTLPLGAQADGTPNITVTNCSSASETLLASGTDATGSTAGVSWTLNPSTGSAGSCPPGGTLGPNQYHLDIAAGALGTWRLMPLPQTLHTIAAGTQASHTMHIVTACPGSTGQGDTMSMQINYTATL